MTMNTQPCGQPISTASPSANPTKSTYLLRSASTGKRTTLDLCPPAHPRTIGDVMRRLREDAQHTSWMLRAEIAEPRDGWTRRALCIGWTDPEPFDNGGRFTWRRAARICHDCPVRLDCLADAWQHEQGVSERIFGVRGGLTASARRREAN